MEIERKEGRVGRGEERKGNERKGRRKRGCIKEHSSRGEEMEI